MPRQEVPLVPIHELTPGQFAEFFALLTSRNKGVTREGKPYYACRFRSNKREVHCMIWADGPWFGDCEREWRDGRYYRIRGLYSIHDRFGPQVEINDLRPVCEEDTAEGFNPRDYVISTRFEPDALFAELMEIVENEIDDPPLRALVKLLLEKYAPSLKELQATENKFYPFRGGWLEHVVSVTRTCLFLADRYVAHYVELDPPLNRDLIVAGAVLHDIGRVVEYGDTPNDPRPTVDGRLSGHLILGRDMVRDAARDIEHINPELVRLLEHIVLTHLSIPEWGSPRLPMIPEVLIIHHADDLDAKMEMYARCITQDQSQGPFTARDPILGKPLLKVRSV